MTKVIVGTAVIDWQSFSSPGISEFMRQFSHIEQATTLQFDGWPELEANLEAAGFEMVTRGGYTGVGMSFFVVTRNGSEVGYACNTGSNVYGSDGSYLGYRASLDSQVVEESGLSRRIQIDSNNFYYAILAVTEDRTAAAQVYRARDDKYLGRVYLDETGSWTPVYAEGVDYLPINEVLPYLFVRAVAGAGR